MKIVYKLIILGILIISGWILLNSISVFFTPGEVVFLFGMELSYVDGRDNSITILTIIGSFIVVVISWILLVNKSKNMKQR